MVIKSACFFFSFCIVATLNAQVVEPKPIRDEQLNSLRSVVDHFTQPANVTISGRFDKTGRLTMYRSMGFSFDRGLEFYKSESLRKEIELVASQGKRFEQEVASWEEGLDQLMKKFHRVRFDFDPVATTAVQKEIAEHNYNSEQEIADVLLSHQFKWVKQIQVRYIVRTHGLKGVVQLDPIRKFADISNAEVSRLTAIRKKTGKFLEERAAQQLKTSVEELFAQFSKDEILSIKERFPEFDKGAIQNLEQLRAHILMIDEFDEHETMESVYEELENFPSFQLAVSGGLQARYPEPVIGKKHYLMRIRVFESAVAAANSVNDLQLTLEEETACREILGNAKEKLRQFGREGFGRTADTKDAYEAAQSKRRKSLDKTCQGVLAEIESVLGKRATSLIDKLSEKLLMRRRGPFVEILHGSLGDELRLSEKDKELFRRKVSEVMEKLDKEAVEIETLILDQQLNCFDDFSKSKLESILGPEIKNSSPSLMGLQLGL